MSTLAFDSLRYARRLREAGVPESQADVQAELMAEAFGFYASNIVTKDYLDETLRARFAEQNVRFAALDVRFAEQDARMAAGFAELRSSQRQLAWMVGGTWLLVGYPLLLDLLSRLA